MWIVDLDLVEKQQNKTQVWQPEMIDSVKY